MKKDNQPREEHIQRVGKGHIILVGAHRVADRWDACGVQHVAAKLLAWVCFPLVPTWPKAFAYAADVPLAVLIVDTSRGSDALPLALGASMELPQAGEADELITVAAPVKLSLKTSHHSLDAA